MKERKRKEEALRSAVTGKKIKLKVKKSSKDKEVNKDWVQKWEILLLISISIMICNVKLKNFLGGSVILLIGVSLFLFEFVKFY